MRLAAPLRSHTFTVPKLRTSHSLPVPDNIWVAHTEALKAAVIDLATSEPSLAGGYESCRRGIEESVNRAARVTSFLFSIQPFAPFDHEAAMRLRELVNHRLAAVAVQIEAGGEVGVDDELRAWAESHCDAAGSEDVGTALCEAFAMSNPPIDEMGDFRPEWVLDHYAYRTHDLLPQLLPHLMSLGVPWLTDMLAAITVVGEVLSCDNPVSAYVQLDAMIGRVLAADSETSATVCRHLRLMEPAIRRARRAAARSCQLVNDTSAESEVRIYALVDTYKRLVEGPFRQLVWANLCLKNGAWQDPPTLRQLRDRLLAAGEGFAPMAKAIIPELRNGEAHETLVWDGFSEHFLTGGVQISPHQVVASAELAQWIIAGCEAGLAAARFLELSENTSLLPDHDEKGRMPAWRRVQAFFGTNHLRLLDASLNTRHASLRVQRCVRTDVNPCFQALLLSRRLMPDVESFSVSVSDGKAVISVGADALTQCMPVWEFAISNLDQMPLSTFLTANFDARVRHEEDGVAIRSVAWIAIDDALDAIDGSTEIWSADDRALLDIRLRLVELAVCCVEDWLATASPRLRSVAESVASLRQWVVAEKPSAPELAECREETVRLRLQWEKWGPVCRHPLVGEVDEVDEGIVPDHRPRIRRPPESLAFRLL